MSAYGMNSALWGVYTSADDSELFLSEPDAYLSRFELETDERDALAARDYGKLLDLGAHPFLIYKMALRTAGGFSMELIERYLGSVSGHELRDIVT